MAHPNLQVERVAGAIGAEIRGIDLARAQADAAIAAIRGLLLEHGVIFFRDQTLNDTTLKAFASRFGTFFRHPYFVPEGDPDVIVIRRAPGDQKIVGEGWHSDTPATPAPPMMSLLYGEEIPTYGGDTLFANQYLAYETLSPGMQRMLENMRIVYSDTRVAGATVGRNAQSATKLREDTGFAHSQGVHPVVRTHPETGRKLLFVNRSYTVGFEGWTEAESKPLLDYLLEHGHRPEFTCRFRWANGSIAFWDNRATKHLAVHDAGPFRRIMRRTQICGGSVY